jgi:hypothetical protein
MLKAAGAVKNNTSGGGKQSRVRVSERGQEWNSIRNDIWDGERGVLFKLARPRDGVYPYPLLKIENAI